LVDIWWEDISVVLRAHMGFPFEPIDKVSLKYLTFNPLPTEPLPTWDTEAFLKVFGEILLRFSG
jgi:hypothetical protein